MSCHADADKRATLAYYEDVLKLTRPGGLIAIDNVLWHGQVCDADDKDKRTIAFRELNAFLMTDERIHFSLVPIGGGMALCNVR